MDDLSKTFPLELLRLVVTLMDDPTRRALRLANTYWFKLVNYSNFTLRFTKPETLPSIIDRLSQYDKPISVHIAQHISLSTNDIIQFSRLTNLVSLSTADELVGKREVSVREWMHLTVLTKLRHFNLGGASYPFKLLNYYSNLTELTVKRMRCHYDRLKSAIEHLPNLESVNLAINPNKEELFSNIQHPNKLTTMHLRLGNRSLSFDLQTIEKMTNLRHLECSHKGMKFPISKLPNLEYLSINASELDTLEFNTKLTALSVQCAYITDEEMQGIGALTKLQELYFSRGLALPDWSLRFLTALTALQSLEYYPNVFDEETSQAGQLLEFIRSTVLTRLEIPALSQTARFPPTLTSLESLLALKMMDFDGRTITDLVNLTQLTIHSTEENFRFSALSVLTRLRDLTIFGSYTILDDDFVSALTNLELLSVQKVTSRTFDSLAGMTRLTKLTCYLEEIQSYNFSLLTTLAALKHLYFAHQGNSDHLWSVLPQLTTLESLSLVEVDSGERFAKLGSLTRLKKLVVFQVDAKEEHFSTLTSLQCLHITNKYHSRLLISHAFNLPFLTNLRN